MNCKKYLLLSRPLLLSCSCLSFAIALLQYPFLYAFIIFPLLLYKGYTKLLSEIEQNHARKLTQPKTTPISKTSNDIPLPSAEIMDQLKEAISNRSLSDSSKNKLNQAYTVLDSLLHSIQRLLDSEENQDCIDEKVIDLLQEHNQIIQHIINDDQKTAKNKLINNDADNVSMEDKKFIDKTIDLINEAMISGDVSVNRLAKKLDMNRTQLYRNIKRITGETATQFIKNVKLTKALTYLKDKSLNVSEVAYMTGFESPWYFSKCFKDKYGRSPSVYQTEQNKNIKEYDRVASRKRYKKL
ncbi:helix-turn-helix domain-containing protein [Fulvivirga sediminis]|uniref:Helix-turn-helix transcriptional regulator n=1 Tax=Fulvivirga sediminis TaxID=2803949 RepID=A0A937JZA0_9BACT|nr:AraC family transcriptional regulator [Fulvivirga sediminis]MBL3657203.1 helix-turn-helix transcriptional regulator [Fulvivirga sediminis]